MVSNLNLLQRNVMLCAPFSLWNIFAMAHSKWSYVKNFELDDKLLPNSWIVARVDGRGFHRLAKTHDWDRPNDLRAIQLMNQAAQDVMKDFNECVLAYGQSDEYSFVFRPSTEIFERRSSKIVTTLVSKFSASYVYCWPKFFGDVKLSYVPSFDARLVLYPTSENLKDYLCWRQADCHINNLYNTTFWSLVKLGKLDNNEAQQRLKGTLASDKNEILFSQFGINYNNEPEVFKKGTILLRKKYDRQNISRKNYLKQKGKAVHEHTEADEIKILEMNCDIIGNKFWEDNPHILNNSE